METANGGIKSLVSLNFILSFLMSLSMSFLWSMINCLQMIVYLPLFNITFPAKLNSLMAILINVATFDIVPKIDEINEFVFNFNHTKEPVKMNS